MIKLLIVLGLSYGAEMPKDSLGLETINGKLFVIHKVDEKETLFAISRRYRTTVDEIVQYNSGAAAGLEIGQILKVPYSVKTLSKGGGDIVHEVAPKETMYSISRKYGVSVEDIRQWNNLSDNTLSIGQQLMIKKAAPAGPVIAAKPVAEIARKGVHTVGHQETLFSISKQYGVSIDQLREWNNIEGNELKIGQTLFVSQPEKNNSEPVKKIETTVETQQPVVKSESTPPVTVTQEPKTEPVKPQTQQTPEAPKTQPQTIKISESYKNGSETVEAGLAELIEGTEGNRKYLALHRTAPIGTILKVRNEMNNREVFVRVMGKLPDTALTDKLIIRISKSAYDRLGAIDPKFRVEVTYYK